MIDNIALTILIDIKANHSKQIAFGIWNEICNCSLSKIEMAFQKQIER